MHKSLIDLKNASDMIDEEKKRERTQRGDNDPIPEIKQQRQRNDSLEQQMAELNAQEKELNLRYKILKKKEQLEKIQLKFDQITAEDSFYTDKTDKEGYTQLRSDKWQNDFQELIIKLKNIELDEFEGKIDLQTAQEAKGNVNKQIKKLISIKKKTNTANTMNKLKRGIQKTMKGIGSFSNEMSKFGSEMSKFGNQVGDGGSNNSTDWENFFNDKPKRSKPTKTTKKRKSRKRKSKTKTTKTTKKRKRKSKTKTQKKPSHDFGGFSF